LSVEPKRGVPGKAQTAKLQNCLTCLQFFFLTWL
jgi:hypothetical protein